MRIAFVYPSYVRHAQANPEIAEDVSAGSYLGSPPMGIALLAGLTPDRHEVVFYDDRIEKVPFDEPFDLVAMPVFTPGAMRAMEIGDEFRKRGTKVVSGGIFSSLMPQEMAPHVDAVCMGEGEPVWLDILRDAENGTLQPVYRASEPFDLAGLPRPRWDLYFAKEGPTGYRSTGPTGELTVDYPVQISRGCPLRCVACAIPEYMGRKMRFAPPEWVADNFRIFAEDGQSRHVSLTEDTTSFPAGKVQSHFAEAMGLSKGLGTTMSYVGASPHQALLAPDEFYAHLRDLGTVSIYMVFGFCPVSRKAFQADQDAKEYQRAIDAVQRVRDQGLGVYASLLVGHDEEDLGVFDQVLEYSQRARIDTAEFVVLTPYPGTPLYRKLSEEDRILTRDWSRYNDANPTFRPKNFTADQLRAGYQYLWKEFYRHNDSARHAVQV